MSMRWLTILQFLEIFAVYGIVTLFLPWRILGKRFHRFSVAEQLIAYFFAGNFYFPVGLSVPFLLFLFMGLTLCVPFMGYYYARMYRNQVCGGGISFLHAWVFTVFMYMFAALLAAVAHYIYFRFIDHGYVINTCETMVDTLAQSNMPGMDSYIATYQEALETARLLSPIDITLQMISSNVFWGSILAFPTALFVMRRKKDDAPAE